MVCVITLVLFGYVVSLSQGLFPHPQAHAHNDYEHTHPLTDALQNGFISVEADVYWQDERLLVSHNLPGKHALTLEKLYLAPLDSIQKANDGHIYPGYLKPFYLMIDCKTKDGTYQAIRKALSNHTALLCLTEGCPVQIFLSGNRPAEEMMKDGYRGLGIDGRPEDVGKGYSSEIMPVISDNYSNWANGSRTSNPTSKDLEKIKDLAQRVHKEGKKLRLWAIPDHEGAWKALLEAGVDFINTDHLAELNQFLTRERIR